MCPPLAAPQLDRIRRTRRHPRRTQPDYLILRYLVNHLERVLDEVRHPVDDVLDLFCGTQPYRDHLPPHTRYVAMDIDDTYGMPDVVSGESCPSRTTPSTSCSSPRSFTTSPIRTAAWRSSGACCAPAGRSCSPCRWWWDYDRRIVERRYTGPQLAELFSGWDEVRVRENGGYSVAWATLTVRILRGLDELVPAKAPDPDRAALFTAASLALNFVATLLAKARRAGTADRSRRGAGLADARPPAGLEGDGGGSGGGEHGARLRNPRCRDRHRTPARCLSLIHI